MSNSGRSYWFGASAPRAIRSRYRPRQPFEVTEGEPGEAAAAEAPALEHPQQPAASVWRSSRDQSPDRRLLLANGALQGAVAPWSQVATAIANFGIAEHQEEASGGYVNGTAMAASLQQRNFATYFSRDLPWHQRPMAASYSNFRMNRAICPPQQMQEHQPPQCQLQEDYNHCPSPLLNDNHRSLSPGFLPGPSQQVPIPNQVPAILGPQNQQDNSRDPVDLISDFLQAVRVDSPLEAFNFSSSGSNSPGSNQGNNLTISPLVPNSDAVNLITDARAGYQTVSSWLKHLRIIRESVERKAQQTVSEIHAMKQHIVSSLDERERQLLLLVDRVRTLKGQALVHQSETLCVSLLSLSKWLELATEAMDRGGMTTEMAAELQQLLAGISASSFQPCENDALLFTPVAFNNVLTIGNITSSGYAPQCCAFGYGVSSALSNTVSTFMVRVKDHLGEPQRVGGDLVSAVLVEPGTQGRWRSAEVEDRGDGTYVVTYRAAFEGLHTMHVYLRGRPIAGSPFCITVRAPRNYKTISQPVMVIGGCEGSAEGQLCRPWGVCCDTFGNIIVADRSNNRIQVFNPDGSFSYSFGRQGTALGEFERPAGVETNAAGQIIVADKDNHRVQVFTSNGNPLFAFGEKGSANGQFNYPWDVAAAPDGRIVVSDTRNHRVQMFTPDGRFICKYGYENSQPMWKHLDSPRGVCFNKDGGVIMTDFNNHRLFLIKPDFSTASYLGCEGQKEMQFLRPQGVAVDLEGHIIVADSRNGRVQVFDPSGGFLAKFGDTSMMDRPSGICVSPDGRIILVDFGHNRVLAF